MDLPPGAPDWASPLVLALLDAGFSVEAEVRGGMAGYSLTLRRAGCLVTVGGDRGDFDVLLAFPNPRRGRGHPREVSMPAEDYVAGLRGDSNESLLMSQAFERNRVVSQWLTRRLAEDTPLALDAQLLDHIRTLQRARARTLFG